MCVFCTNAFARFAALFPPKEAAQPKAAQLTRFVKYALTLGTKFEAKLIFAPLPHSILVADVKSLYKIKGS